MDNLEVLTRLCMNLNPVKSVVTYSIECAEKCLTTCKTYHDPCKIKAKSEKRAAKKLYRQGWRNVSYDGYESFACSDCIKHMKEDEHSYANFKTEELTT